MASKPTRGIRPSRIATGVLLIFALVFSSETIARAELDGDRFSSEEWRVRLTGPKGWQLSEHASYPSILLWIVHRRPAARMLFSAEQLTGATDAQGYALKTFERLESLGFTVRAPQLHSATGAYWIDFDNGKQYLRQALLVPSQLGTAYALTLSAPNPRTRGQLLRAFDQVLRSIVPTRNKVGTSGAD